MHSNEIFQVYDIVMTGSESPPLTQREGHEKGVCSRLEVLIGATHELVQSVLPVGPCTEQLMKLLIHLYTTLTMLVKYVSYMYCVGLAQD